MKGSFPHMVPVLVESADYKSENEKVRGCGGGSERTKFWAVAFLASCYKKWKERVQFSATEHSQTVTITPGEWRVWNTVNGFKR